MALYIRLICFCLIVGCMDVLGQHSSPFEDTAGLLTIPTPVCRVKTKVFINTTAQLICQIKSFQGNESVKLKWSFFTRSVRVEEKSSSFAAFHLFTEMDNYREFTCVAGPDNHGPNCSLTPLQIPTNVTLRIVDNGTDDGTIAFKCYAEAVPRVTSYVWGVLEAESSSDNNWVELQGDDKRISDNGTVLVISLGNIASRPVLVACTASNELGLTGSDTRKYQFVPNQSVPTTLAMPTMVSPIDIDMSDTEKLVIIVLSVLIITTVTTVSCIWILRFMRLQRRKTSGGKFDGVELSDRQGRSSGQRRRLCVNDIHVLTGSSEDNAIIMMNVGSGESPVDVSSPEVPRSSLPLHPSRQGEEERRGNPGEGGKKNDDLGDECGGVLVAGSTLLDARGASNKPCHGSYQRNRKQITTHQEDDDLQDSSQPLQSDPLFGEPFGEDQQWGVWDAVQDAGEGGSKKAIESEPLHYGYCLINPESSSQTVNKSHPAGGITQVDCGYASISIDDILDQDLDTEKHNSSDSPSRASGYSDKKVCVVTPLCQPPRYLMNRGISTSLTPSSQDVLYAVPHKPQCKPQKPASIGGSSKAKKGHRGTTSGSQTSKKSELIYAVPDKPGTPTASSSNRQQQSISCEPPVYAVLETDDNEKSE